jgi:hypothetical protein
MANTTDTTTPTWDFSAKPWTDPAPGAGKAGTGDTGGNGDDGTNHWDSGQTKNICDKQPTQGKQGGPGRTPAKPSKAQNGRPTAIVTQNLGVCKGAVTIWYGAGDGQKGGHGGEGGDGGPGGPPGQCPGGCNPADKGPQGPGGQGGDGGDGGDGGVTGLITIYYTDGGATFDYKQVGCGGGEPGDPGNPGKGTGDNGSGGTGGRGTPSTPPRININKQ